MLRWIDGIIVNVLACVQGLGVAVKAKSALFDSKAFLANAMGGYDARV